jgi:hypothetical protein
MNRQCCFSFAVVYVQYEQTKCLLLTGVGSVTCFVVVSWKSP